MSVTQRHSRLGANRSVGPTLNQDTRGIVDPARFRQQVTLNRYQPGPELVGLVEFFWVVSYDLPPGEVHSQQLITHPCVNVSVAHGQVGDDGRPRPLEARVTGVPRQLYTRRIAGRGWAVALKSTPGGFGAFIPGPVAVLNDQVCAVDTVLDLDPATLVAEVAGAADELAQVAALEQRLGALLAAADPARIRSAREVSEVTALAQADRSLRRLDHLTAACGIGARTLQRLFTEYVGVPPTWVLRRYRLLEAAETVRDGGPVNWAAIAADLGYSDQAHLVRDFRATVGTTPAAYAAKQSAG